MTAQVAADLFGRVIGTCSTCRTVVVKDDVARSIREWQCPTCPGYVPVRVAAVRGSVTEKPCDSRCTSGRGRICQCSCGGLRHGSAWLWANAAETPGRSLASATNYRPGGAE